MTEIDNAAWDLYCAETAGSMDVRDFWEELSDSVKDIFREKVRINSLSFAEQAIYEATARKKCKRCNGEGTIMHGMGRSYGEIDCPNCYGRGFIV